MELFNTSDLTDLPDNVLKELRLSGEKAKKVLFLFQDANEEIGLNQVIVAYYRKYNIVETRNYFMTSCYRLFKQGFLIKGKTKGAYRISDLGKIVIKSGQ